LFYQIAGGEVTKERLENLNFEAKKWGFRKLNSLEGGEG